MILSFTHPLVLFLLPLPVAVLIWVWRRRSRRVVLPLDHGTSGRGPLLRLVLDAAESLPALLLAVVIAILAGPQQLSEPKTKRALTNIQFCVDVSGSMGVPFGNGTRYDASMEAINWFLDFREGDAFGLTFFGNNVLHWVPLTSDTSAFRCAPPFMKPGNLPPGYSGTEIAKALLACRDVLRARDEGDRMIVLVSDGFSSDLSGGNDASLARKLRADDITVYAIHISDTEVPPPIVNITSLTGGAVFNPGDNESLKDVFQSIDEMQEVRLDKSIAETMDQFVPACIVGLCLIGLTLVSSLGVRYTPW